VKIKFNIDEAENIALRLQENNIGFESQSRLLKSEADTLALTWQGVSAETFKKQVEGFLAKGYEEYTIQIIALQQITRSFAEAKEAVSKSSASLKSFIPSVFFGADVSGNVAKAAIGQNSTTSKASITSALLGADASGAASLDENTRSKIMSFADIYSQVINMFRQEIDFIRGAWKDGDESGVVFLLEMCIGKYMEVVDSLRRIANTR